MEDGKLSYNPLYLQVKDALTKRIVSGVYRPGDSIPSESRLAGEFGTSISTIRQALSLLVSDGYLVKKQGKGTIVSEKKVKISFLSWLGETRLGEEILNDLIRQFEEKYPPAVIDVIPTTYPETRNTLLRLISSGRAPDVAQIVSHWTSFFASTGALEPLDRLLSEENLSSRLPAQDLFGGTYLNSLYSVAWGLCPIALIANKAVLARAGIQRLDSPMSLDSFREHCRAISALPGDEPFAFGLWYTTAEENNFLSLYTFLQAFRGGLIGDGGDIRFDSAENVAAFAWLRDFVSTTRIFSSDIFTIRKRFAEGRIGFISDGPWIKYLLEELTGESFERNFQVVLNPVRTKSQSYSWTFNHALVICSQSANKLYAARFIEALTNDRELSRWFSLRTGMLPPTRQLLGSGEFAGEFYSTYAEQLRQAKALDATSPMFERAMVLCIDAVKKILFEGADIEKELAEKEYYLKMLYYGMRERGKEVMAGV